MKKLLRGFLAFAMFSSISLMAQTTTIHCWDFNAGEVPITTVRHKWPSPVDTLARVAGQGSITHNFTDSVNRFAGSTLNACTGSASGGSMCPENANNNGKHFDFNFPTTGFENISLSFWSQRTNTGFDSLAVWYSTDGSTFTYFTSLVVVALPGSILNVDFSTIPAVNNNANFKTRIQIFGASGPSGNMRFDNIKLEGTPLSTANPTRSTTLHYWHLNDLTSGAKDSVFADTSVFAVAPAITYPGTGTGFMDRNQNDGSLDNARFGQVAGNSLRARNPSDTRSLIIDLPTTGYEDALFSYEVYRTGNGQLSQTVEYTTNGTTYVQIDSFTVTTTYQTRFYDFASIPAADDNANFKIRINFYGQNSGPDGNNRFDNFVLEAEPLPTTPAVPTYAISQIKGVDAQGVADSLNVICIIEGIVSGGNLRSATQSGVEFWLIDSVNSTGLMVRDINYNGYTVTEGDKISVQGRVGQFRGLIQFENLDTIIILSQNNTLPASFNTTVPTEATEGRLIRIDSVQFTTGATWNASGGFNSTLYNTVGDTFTLRINAFTTASGAPQPTGFFAIQGHGSQFSATIPAPHLDGYQIQPRYASDLIIYSTPPPPPSVPLYNISQITGVNAQGVADSLNVNCAIEGYVSGFNLRSPTQSGVEFWLIDSINSDGLMVRDLAYSSYTVTEGDKIRVEGTVGQFRGLIQFSVDTIFVISQNNTLPAPFVTTKPVEATEGRLIKVDSVQLTAASTWSTSGGFNATVYNTVGDTFTLRINGNTTASGVPQPVGFFNLTGHGSQFNSTTTAPFLDGYQLQPRYASDIQLLSTPPPPPTSIPTYTLSQINGVNAQGVLDSLNVNCRITVIVSGGNLLSPTQTGFQMWAVDSTNSAGVMVRRTGTNLGYTQVNEGDVLQLMGKVTQFRGLFQFEPDSMHVLGSNFTLPPHVVVSQLTEAEEGRIIELQNLTLVNPAQWSTPSTVGLNVDVTNGVDTFLVRLHQFTSIINTPAPVGTFNLRGHGSQFSPTSTAPFVGGYQLQPRYEQDLIITTVPPTYDLYVSEVMARSLSTDPAVDGDWFEIMNYGTSTISLDGFSWDDDKLRPGVNIFPNGIDIAPGEAIVVWDGNSADLAAFKAKWLMSNSNVQVLTKDQFTGTGGFPGLGTNNDLVVLYDNLDLEISRSAWGFGTPGFSFNFDTAGTFTALSVNGVNGSYTSTAGDVGSPGNFNVSVKEFAKLDGRIYPNPAQDRVTVEVGNMYQGVLELVNIHGQIIMSTEFTNNRADIYVGNLPRGNYLIRVTGAQSTGTAKLILK